MQVVVSVIHRDSPRGQDGRVYVVDWSTQRVVHDFAPPPAMIQDFPDAGGGGLRGYRGICFASGLCYVASADALYGYDTSWELQRTISHPLFSDLHEIAWDGEALWVTSTGLDAVLRVSEQGDLLEAIWLGELENPLSNGVEIAGRSVDKSLDHRLLHHPMREVHVAHPNAIQIVDGRPIVTLYFQGAVVGLNPVEVLWADLDYYGSHSGRLRDGSIYLAASFKQALLAEHLESGARRSVRVLSEADDSRGLVLRGMQAAALWLDAHSGIARYLSTRLPQWANPKPQRNRPGWTRGLCFVDQDRALLGSSPASVLEIDLSNSTVVQRMELSSRVPEAVFSVEIDPRTASSAEA